MAFLISHKFCSRLISSSHSYSLYSSHSQLSRTITKPSFCFPLLLLSTLSKSNKFSPSPQENPTSVSSSSHAIARSVVFQNASQNHENLLGLATFKRSSMPKIFSAYGFSTKSENHENLNSRRIIHAKSDLSPATKIEIRETMENMLILKWAMTAECVVQLCLGSCMVYVVPFPQIVSIQNFVASTVPLWLAMKMSLKLQGMQQVSSQREMEEAFQEASSVAETVSDVTFSLFFVHMILVILTIWMPVVLRLPIPDLKIYLQSISVFLFPLFNFEFLPNFLLEGSRSALNRFLIRSWKATFVAAGLSWLILLTVLPH